VAGPKLRLIGDIDPADLRILFEARGLEFLPYPIAQYGARSLGKADKYAQHVADVLTGFEDGDLAKFASPLEIALSRPDLRVEYYAHDLKADEAIHRVAAFRRGDHACLLRQVGSDDRVEIATLSPFDIGAAIAEMAPGLRPGPHPTVSIEGYTQTRSVAAASTSPASVTQRVSSSGDLPHVEATEVRGFGSVQSDWRPARDWGRDPLKELIRWVYTDGGAYVVERDGETAKPVTPSSLRTRIDEGIAADVASIRTARTR
jgi:hypothetical protein